VVACDRVRSGAVLMHTCSSSALTAAGGKLAPVVAHVGYTGSAAAAVVVALAVAETVAAAV
jgi:hypothetical protein